MKNNETLCICGWRRSCLVGYLRQHQRQPSNRLQLGATSFFFREGDLGSHHRGEPRPGTAREMLRCNGEPVGLCGHLEFVSEPGIELAASRFC